MFGKPSLVTRIAVGKLSGLVIGLLGFIMLPWFYPEVGALLRWGVLLWYTTLGAIIGIYGVFNYHPILKIPLPWYFRAPLIGAWMNFVLVFFAYTEMQRAMDALLGGGSPFWFALEGAIVGLIIGWLATWLGGEGPETAGK